MIQNDETYTERQTKEKPKLFDKQKELQTEKKNMTRPARTSIQTDGNKIAQYK